MNASYRSALTCATELAPPVEKATEFIRWAEDICQLLCHIYGRAYDDVTEELFAACKEDQDYEDESEED